jgi:hypothetical protein
MLITAIFLNCLENCQSCGEGFLDIKYVSFSSTTSVRNITEVRAETRVFFVESNR